ncbi:LamG domain-containing protein [Pseudemcibacter aquimaris]|uniref:LamG domain-containing protein n=1 Tax=Pseudemcibacter aquimaris TaxID=2857064 RepID=UPI002010EDE2|nr:LamG domain-containing protein [Pseudemcibacter aquimaris]MCC3860065.1 LamG domain-containing protein [Pseudemcibacter aquimaris]WDU57394.1 LamG domain-containing protein [Pseudemcibacter aquimaris]
MGKILKTVLFFMISSQLAYSNDNVDKVASTKGLVAFWDFKKSDQNAFKSYFDKDVTHKEFPVYLRRIGDQNRYDVKGWPYHDELSKVIIDQTGPFGHGIRLNKGYIYGEVPRSEFDGSELDLTGKKPFTMVAWVRFDGNRHMVAGIWDEGGWNRYAGERQAALFAGLFNQKGVIAHISSTGAASYPQSNVDGAQYARIRAIDGQAFENEKWVAIAMTFDPENGVVKAYLNGELTKYRIPDPVTEDVMQNAVIPLANPFTFTQALYGPKNFQLKFNGYDFHNNPIKEHFLWVDLNDKKIVYDQTGSDPEKRFRLTFDVERDGRSIFVHKIMKEVTKKTTIGISQAVNVNDKIITGLEEYRNGSWVKVGTNVEKIVSEGAPFTFARALGLDEDGIDHGSSELYMDGVAVFNRVLSADELKGISFVP